MKRRTILFTLILLLALFASAEIPEDRGAMGLSQALKRLDVIASVLHTGAHPDDENSALLAWLSRGRGVRTAYLSATRGDGGQNLLGTELFEALGVIRTEELLAARRFDRAQQFFTPAYEFGFSKTADESFEKWGREQMLADFVRVIRQFRPEIIVSRFTGTTRDGHGHHQAAGIITREAFRAAADPNRFAEYGKPWQAKKLYLNAAAGGPASVTINVGEFDAALGRSYNEIAAEGRSLHRSQSQGAAQERGPRMVGLQAADKTIDIEETADLFAGVLHRLPDLAQLAPDLSNDLAQLEQRVTAIRQKASLSRPADLVPDLAAALKQLQDIHRRSRDEHVRFLLEQKIPDFQEALQLAAGLVVDVLASDDTVLPGQEFNVTVSVVNGGPLEFQAPRASMDLPSGWSAVPVETTGSLSAGQRWDQRFRVTVSSNPDWTQPYWLREPRRGDRFVWPTGSATAMPFDPPLAVGRASIDYGGVAISLEKPAQLRRVDGMYGDLRSLVNAVPALSVQVSPKAAVIPLSGDRRKEFTVTVESQNASPIEGDVRLVAPSGWTVTPALQKVRFTRQGEKASAQFTVTAPRGAGEYRVHAIVQAAGREFRTGYTRIAYPHIETRYIYAPAESRVDVFDVRTRVTSVGYVEGAGDQIPEALRELGVRVTALSAEDLAHADLSQFPAIVLGVRAFAVREDLRAYRSRLLDYVSNGGTLVVQYNRRSETRDIQIGPYPFTIDDNGRVTKEEAPVRILDASHPVLNVPNKITAADFGGWVQERGNYFLSAWDPQYTPLLESGDPGEEPKKGGLVIARYGKGSYVYTGYGFFRQLPEGVPGAYRLFANLISIQN